ncbi:translocation/assembly module TamB domain-containing protein [Wenzhouxiangella sp. EGI_FJ10305]|uniref:hypothetical protein n=1 Tax=Wenzhouxiangella sp. EGI_FJ10305 TaxID=3243768 RepID=UPI0035E05310
MTGKTAIILIGLTLQVAGVQAENRLLLESAAGRAGPVSWQSATLSMMPSEDPEAGSSWRMDIDGLAIAGREGSLSVDCSRGGLQSARPWCASGRLEWREAGEGARLSGRLSRPENGKGIAFELDDGGLSGRFEWPSDGDDGLPRGMIRFDGFDLATLPVGLLQPLGLSVLEGRLKGIAELSGRGVTLDLDIVEAGFDRADGRVAGAGLSLGLSGELTGLTAGEPLAFSAQLSQSAGELLAGPIYLPPPERPLKLDLAGAFKPGEKLSVDALMIDDGGLLEAEGRLAFEVAEGGWRLAELGIDRARVEFPGAWQRWADGPASTSGVPDLATEGELSASLLWRSGGVESLEVRLDGFSARDAAGRFAVDSVNGRLERSAERLQADLAWNGFELFRLAFGGSRLTAGGAPGDWRLTRPLRLPLLDGAVVVDRLNVGVDDAGARSVTLDASIEPLDLAALTDMLGLPSFGGRLSGSFPGVRVSGETLVFDGGIDVRAFSGAIRMSDLVVERPFGTLPALAAQVEIDRLDLEELTGAFNFGHMEGEVSGWMRGLRLLDWQPVAMDARLYTHEDVSSRRISQRAVENLSRIGGGAAAIGATVLRMFEEFPYRRAGLACRLDRNICHIDGVAPHESGGFYIVEGRGLPHLDVVGHRRLVDWPRLVAQLVAVTSG